MKPTKQPEDSRKPRPIDRLEVPKGGAVITKPLEPTITDDDTMVLTVEFDGEKPKTFWKIDGKDPKLNRDAVVEVKDNVATLTLKNKDKYLKSDIKFTVENDTAQSNNSFTVKDNRPVVSDTFIDKTIKKKSSLDEAPKIVTPFTVKRVKNVSLIEGKVGGRPTPTITWTVNGQPVAPKDTVFKQTKKPDGTIVFEVPDDETKNGLEIVFVAENSLGSVDYTFVLTADKPKSLDLDSTLEALLLLADPELLKTLSISKPMEEYEAYDYPSQPTEEFDEPMEEPEKTKPGEKPKDAEKAKEADAPKEPEKTKPGEKPKEAEKARDADKTKEPEKTKPGEKPKDADKTKEPEKTKPGEKPKEPEKTKEPEKPKPGEKPKDANKTKEPAKTKPGEKPNEPEKAKDADKPKEAEKTKPGEKPKDANKTKEPEKTKPGEKPKEPEKTKEAEKPKD